MGKGGVFGKVALVLGFLAFQLHMITMSVGKYEVKNPSANSECDDTKAANDAVLAFLIIDFIILISCCILLLLMNFSGMGDSKIILIITIAGLFTAAVLGVMGVSIYEGCQRDKNGNNSGQSIAPFTTTTYISAAGFAMLSAIFLIVEMCCG